MKAKERQYLSNKEQMKELDQQLSEKTENIWKVFGRETEAGRLLHNLYRPAKAPKINYPKVKTKNAQQLAQEKSASVQKPCPQKTVIEYPELSQPTRKKTHMIDIVPRRKGQQEIQHEIDNYYSKPVRPNDKGIDREAEKDKLAQKFKYQKSCLPAKAALQYDQQTVENIMAQKEQVRQKALQKVHRSKLELMGLDRPNKEAPPKKYEDQAEELNHLFAQVMAEIEDRQKYLEDIASLDEPELKDKIKREVIERVSELQKITKLKDQLKQAK